MKPQPPVTARILFSHMPQLTPLAFSPSSSPDKEASAFTLHWSSSSRAYRSPYPRQDSRPRASSGNGDHADAETLSSVSSIAPANAPASSLGTTVIRSARAGHVGKIRPSGHIRTDQGQSRWRAPVPELTPDLPAARPSQIRSPTGRSPSECSAPLGRGE